MITPRTDYATDPPERDAEMEDVIWECRAEDRREKREGKR